MRRGQPLGPTSDQEVEDFIYDALDFLPGTSEVEVRCEGGRATLTGTVQRKRFKRDVGEIAWAIPAVNDVQNNVGIAARRRSRSQRSEIEPPIGSARTKTGLICSAGRWRHGMCQPNLSNRQRPSLRSRLARRV